MAFGAKIKNKTSKPAWSLWRFSPRVLYVFLLPGKKHTHTPSRWMPLFASRIILWLYNNTSILAITHEKSRPRAVLFRLTPAFWQVVRRILNSKSVDPWWIRIRTSIRCQVKNRHQIEPKQNIMTIQVVNWIFLVIKTHSKFQTAFD